MPKMDDAKLEALVSELGVADDWMANQVQTEAATQGVGAIVGAKSDPFTRLLDLCLDAGWRMIMAAFRALIPNLFLRYAAGHWLDEHGLDMGIERDLGAKTILTLDLSKTAGTPLAAPAGTVFYILEAEPRRFQTLIDLSPLDADTAFTVQVEALCPESLYLDGRTQMFSAAYNPAAGLEWASESQLPLDLVSYAGVADNAGTDPEDDETYRVRLLNLKSLKNFLLGGWMYYERLIKTVSGVAQATLDSTDPNTGTMSITLYGVTGEVPGATLAEAQTTFDGKKMLTDQGNLSAAAPSNLAISLPYKNGGTNAEMLQAVADFFSGIANGTRAGIVRGAGFESCDLHDYLQEDWPDIKTRISPISAALPTGKFFVPNTTLSAL